MYAYVYCVYNCNYVYSQRSWLECSHQVCTLMSTVYITVIMSIVRDGVMVRVLTSSAVDLMIEFWLGAVKDYELIFAASPLSNRSKVWAVVAVIVW